MSAKKRKSSEAELKRTESKNSASKRKSIEISKTSLNSGENDEEEYDEEADIQEQKDTGDLSGDWGKQVFCNRHYKAFLPIFFILHLFGRFPFKTTLLKQGLYQYSFKWRYPSALYFYVTTFIMFGTLILGFWNLFQIKTELNISNKEKTSLDFRVERRLESLLISRYFIPLIYVYSMLVHGCITSFLFFKRRQYIAQYLGFWSRAVYTLHMDVSKSARTYSIRITIYLVVATIIMAFLTAFNIGPTCRTLPLVVGDLTFRQLIFRKNWLIDANGGTKRIVRIFGWIFLVLICFGSKCAIIWFIFFCKKLRNAFAYWNGRMYAAILREGKEAQTEYGRTTLRLLFKDHCILLDLLEGINQIYSFVIESFYVCQVFSLSFEIYFVVRTLKTKDDPYKAAYPDEYPQRAYFIRPGDWAPGILMMLTSIIIISLASKAACDMAEEAMAGLEVLRRKTMMGRKTDDELYFTLSMFSSYTAYRKIQLEGGGYAYINKNFIMALMVAISWYFIIVNQFQPVMDLSYSAINNAASRAAYEKFLLQIEK